MLLPINVQSSRPDAASGSRRAPRASGLPGGSRGLLGRRIQSALLPLALCALPAVLLALPAEAQLNQAVPRGTEQAGVEQKIGAQLPLETEFFGVDGQAVTLQSLFHQGRPVLLTLNYSNCPQLCVLQLDGVMKACAAVGLEMGKDFDLITVSVDPTERPERAAATRERYFSRFEGQRTESAWSFLTSPYEPRIRAVADSVGYGYWLDPKTGEYSHEAVLMVLTEEGVVSRYLFGIEYPSSDLRFALVEAAKGKLGSLADRIRFMCYRYDPTTGTYALVAMRVMRLGGLLTVLILGTTLMFFWRREISSLLRGRDSSTHSAKPGAPGAQGRP